MVKEMWYKNISSFSPFDIKKVIGIFASQVRFQSDILLNLI